MPAPFVTLIVAPFEAAAGHDPALARGFGADIAAELTRFPQFAVVLAETREEAVQLAESSAETAPCSLLLGGFRAWGEGFRIQVRLEDGRDRRHRWAGRYDVTDLREVHDEICARLVNALAAGMEQALLAQARRRPPETLAAYECWLRGMDALQRGTPAADDEARGFFERALALDPHYAEAQAGLSLAHFNEWSCQAWDRWEEKEAAAYDAALRAAEMDPHHARIQVVLGRIEQYRREFDRAAPRLERALALAPNDALVLVQLALGFAMQGDPERGRPLGRRALELHPLLPGWCYAYAGGPEFLLGNDEEFLALAARVPPRSIVDVSAFRAAACAFLGRSDEAARHLDAFRAEFRERIATGRPTDDGEMLRWLVHVNPFRDPAHTQRLTDGVRRAGLAAPEPRRIMTQPAPWKIANTFRREGAGWTLAYEHAAVTMPDLRGLHDLARLLAQPGRTVAADALAGGGLVAGGLEATDPAALRAYRRRLREIDADLAAAATNPVEQSRLAEEREALLEELGRITGLGGKVRRSGATQERARTSVTWRIRHAIRRVGAVHPALGGHLGHSIRTGAECGYFPETPVSWSL